MNVLITSDAYKRLVVMLTSASSPFARYENAHFFSMPSQHDYPMPLRIQLKEVKILLGN